MVILTDILEQVERALTLYSHQMIDEAHNANSKSVRLVVHKAINSGTGIPSTVRTDFSSDVWGQSASDFLTSVKARTKKQIEDIFKACSDLQRKGNTFHEQPTMEQGASSRANLHSDPDDSDIESEAVPLPTMPSNYEDYEDAADPADESDDRDGTSSLTGDEND